MVFWSCWLIIYVLILAAGLLGDKLSYLPGEVKTQEPIYERRGELIYRQPYNVVQADPGQVIIILFFYWQHKSNLIQFTKTPQVQ